MTRSGHTGSRAGGEECATSSPPPARPCLPLEIVGPLDAKGFIVPTPTPWTPAFEGLGDVDYVCGSCGRVVCRSVKRGLFAGMIFRCVGCNKLNRVRGASARLSAFP